MKFKVQNRDSTLEKEMPVNKILAYFEGGNISTGAITVTTHDDAYIADGLGFKTLQKVQKYQVDVLGNYTPVKKKTANLPCPTEVNYVLPLSDDREPCAHPLQNEQLLIETEEVHSVPIEDISAIVLESRQSTITTAAMAALTQTVW